MMRLFFGVPLPHAASAALEAVMQRVPMRRGWRAVEARNWHITLSFLGETDGRLLNPLIELGERVAAAHDATKVTLDGLHWWPSDNRPRLLAAVASVSDALQPMRRELNAGLREIGASYDSKPLRAHVTLLRLERGVLIDDLSVPACNVDIPVEELALFVSEGGSKDKYYRPLWQQTLNQPPPWGWRKT